MNLSTSLAIAAGIFVAASIISFFINFLRLESEYQLAFRKRSKPGKLVNLAVIGPLAMGIVFGSIAARPYFAFGLVLYMAFSIPIQHRSLSKLGFPLPWVRINSAISVLASIGYLLLATAFVWGFRI